MYIFTLALPSPLPSPERLAFADLLAEQVLWQARALAQVGYAQAGIEGEEFDK